MDDSMTKN